MLRRRVLAGTVMVSPSVRRRGFSSVSISTKGIARMGVTPVDWMLLRFSRIRPSLHAT